MPNDTLSAKITPQQRIAFTAARGEIKQSDAVRMALQEWVESRGGVWPEFVMGKHGGNRKSKEFRDQMNRG